MVCNKPAMYDNARFLFYLFIYIFFYKLIMKRTVVFSSDIQTKAVSFFVAKAMAVGCCYGHRIVSFNAWSHGNQAIAAATKLFTALLSFFFFSKPHLKLCLWLWALCDDGNTLQNVHCFKIYYGTQTRAVAQAGAGAVAVARAVAAAEVWKSSQIRAGRKHSLVPVFLV